jgi:uncharacterized membrane protein
MSFCANCGAAVEGRYCSKCGAAVGGPDQTPGGPRFSAPAAGAGLSDRAAAALCYALLVITGVLFLILEPYNRNRTIRFHAFQAIFLGLAWFVISAAVAIVFGAIHPLAAFLFLSPLVSLAFFVLWIYMIVTAYQGQTVVLPVIGPLAQQQA